MSLQFYPIPIVRPERTQYIQLCTSTIRCLSSSNDNLPLSVFLCNSYMELDPDSLEILCAEKHSNAHTHTHRTNLHISIVCLNNLFYLHICCQNGLQPFISGIEWNEIKRRWTIAFKWWNIEIS